MMKMARIAQQFFDSMPKQDLRKIVWLISSNNFTEIPAVKDILSKTGGSSSLSRTGESRGGGFGGEFSKGGEGSVSGDNSSLFNFNTGGMSQLSGGGFSFAFSHLG